MRTVPRFPLRHRVIRPGLWVLLLFTLVPWVAQGQQLKRLRPTPGEYRSPQRFAFEVKFGPYVPHPDNSPDLVNPDGTKAYPFRDVFGTPQTDEKGNYNGTFRPAPRRLLTTVEFDWQFWHRFGSLGFGVSAGIMRRTALGLSYTQVNGKNVSCQFVKDQLPCERSGDRVAFGVVPLTLELVYRFDVLAKRYRVPLVPYLKGGVAYYIWWSTDANGLTTFENSNGSKERSLGGVFGLVAHPGLAFLLDIIDPAASQVIDSELGINHVYLFAELNYSWVNGFGSKTTRYLAGNLDLSDLTWNAGIAFEF